MCVGGCFCFQSWLLADVCYSRLFPPPPLHLSVLSPPPPPFFSYVLVSSSYALVNPWQLQRKKKIWALIVEELEFFEFGSWCFSFVTEHGFDATLQFTSQNFQGFGQFSMIHAHGFSFSVLLERVVHSSLGLLLRTLEMFRRCGEF